MDDIYTFHDEKSKEKEFEAEIIKLASIVSKLHTIVFSMQITKNYDFKDSKISNKNIINYLEEIINCISAENKNLKNIIKNIK